MPADLILQRLSALHPKSIDLSLDRVLRLLGRLDAPHRRLPPVVHVAGTNGKGSTVAYLRAMAEAAGRRVHVYTSPHLVRFNERIRLAGALIADDHLNDVLARCEAANDGAPITLFEITTAAAFVAFAETPADLVLLETGLGGRLDATNVVPHPALTAITPISFDHMDYLGHTLAAIAGEKAGIMKPGAPCVVAPQPNEAMAVFIQRASRMGAPLRRANIEWHVAARDGGLLWTGPDARYTLPLPALPGAHQVDNAGTAIACAHLLNLPEAAMRDGLRRAEWPARLQRLTTGPLVQLTRGELWLDGGHNPSAGEALAAELRRRNVQPAHLIVGMLANKDASGVLAPFAGLVDSVRTVAIPGQPNSHTAESLAAVARDAGLPATPAESITSAMRPDAGLTLIAGSLYLAGEVLRENS